MFCPRSCIDDDNTPPGRVTPDEIYQGMQKYRKVKSLGGPAEFEGESPADLAPRYSWFFATVDGVITRFKAEVNDALSRLSAKVARSRSMRVKAD